MPDRLTLFTRAFWVAAFHRAIRSAAQGALTAIGTTALFFDVHWVAVGSSGLMMAVLSVLTAVATDLPEVEG